MSCTLLGPAHEKTGDPCQDSGRVSVLGEEQDSTLVACVADGAGSARFSDRGSDIVSRVICDNAASHLKSHEGMNGLSRNDVLSWCEHAKREIQEQADSFGCETREFATTLCAAIISQQNCVFFQIGDGAIILRRNGVYGVVFWPQSGEYANMTNFITADDYQDKFEYLATSVSFSDVALFTDGIERMALDFETQTPFAPFFDPLLNTLSKSDSSLDLGEDLRRLLQSDSVRERSDDDKTLIVATRSVH